MIFSWVNQREDLYYELHDRKLLHVVCYYLFLLFRICAEYQKQYEFKITMYTGIYEYQKPYTLYRYKNEYNSILRSTSFMTYLDKR